MISRRAFLAAAPALAVGVTQAPAIMAALPPPAVPFGGFTPAQLYISLSRDTAVNKVALVKQLIENALDQHDDAIEAALFGTTRR